MLSNAAILENIPRLRRYARALTGDRHAADDLVQDTLERALGRSALFRPGSDARAWLFGIMHNQFVNHVRSAAARRTVHADPWMPEPAAVDTAHERAALGDIARMLGQLPIEQREVLLLISLEELTYQQAARVLGVPLGTVMSRLSRAREALRVMLAGESTGTGLKIVR